MFREHANSLHTSGGLGGLYRFSGPGDPLWERGMDVLLVFTIALVLLALVNAILVTWATVQDARHASAIERALGASPNQVGWALVVAQLLPALPGAILGIPVGVGLYDAVGQARLDASFCTGSPRCARRHPAGRRTPDEHPGPHRRPYVRRGFSKSELA